MLEFICPGCLSVHAANVAFAGLRARCVVCGAYLRIPQASGLTAESLDAPRAGRSAPSPSLSQSRPKARGARPGNRANPGRDGNRNYDIEDEPELDLLTVDDEPVAPSRDRRPQARSVRPTVDLDDIDDDFVMTTDEAEEKAREDEEESAEGGSETKKKKKKEVAATDAPAAAPSGAEQLKRKKNKQRIGIAAAVLVLLGGGGYFAFSGDSKPKVVAQNDPPPPPKKEEKKEEPKKVEPKKEVKLPPPVVVAVAPHPHQPGPPVPFAASRLISERKESIVAFEQAYLGRPMIITGMCGSSSPTQLVFSEGETEIGGIACLLAQDAPPKKGLGKVFATEPPTKAAPVQKLQPGQVMVVRGYYTGDLRLVDCELVKTASVADEEFRDKVIELTGTVGAESKGLGGEVTNSIVLAPPTTDCLLTVRCLFRDSDSGTLAKLKPGQPVTVRGRCEGRLFRVVRLHDCTLVAGDAPPGDMSRVPSERFFTVFEADLLPVPRPDPAVPPVVVSAEQLAAAYGADPRQANETYGYKLLQVNGRVIERRLQSQTLVFETSTSDRYRVAGVFMPVKFATLREEATVTVRGTCVGVRGGVVRLENAERYDADRDNSAVRTTAEYVPFRAGRELTLDVLTPTQLKENLIQRFTVRYIDPDLVRVTPTRTGTMAGTTLLGDKQPQPKWTIDHAKQKNPPPTQVTRYRLNDDTIEYRPATAAGAWDPVLKLGMKRGESWSSDLPDGRVVTSTVMAFTRDEQERQLLEIRRVTKHPQNPNLWEEETRTYAKGIGEVRRVVSRQATNGKAAVVQEMLFYDSKDVKKPEEPEKD